MDKAKLLKALAVDITVNAGDDEDFIILGEALAQGLIVEKEKYVYVLTDLGKKLIGMIPEINSLWAHKNGVQYQVVLIANEDSVNPDYPVTVVYRGENGKVWAKPLDNFLLKMSPL